MNEPGIFELRTAEQLLDKIRHDLGRLEEEPTSSYIAFDFFVTAYHMVEWAVPKKERRDLERSSPLLQVCHDVANGAKHFTITNQRPKAQGTGFDEGEFSAQFSEQFRIDRLVISLDAATAASLEVPQSVGAVPFARKALAFWVRHLS